MADATISRDPLSQSAARRHAGKWVALRGGRVIASADSFKELLANRRVRRDDAFYRVPPAGSYFY